MFLDSNDHDATDDNDNYDDTWRDVALSINNTIIFLIINRGSWQVACNKFSFITVVDGEEDDDDDDDDDVNGLTTLI